jgi:hypothetical protein
MNTQPPSGRMRVHVALGYVLVMLEPEGLMESVAIRGEAEIKVVGNRISFEPRGLQSRAARGPRWNSFYPACFNQ